jgi:hypothetical protein
MSERRVLVPAILSDPVADVLAAADKLRADDRLVASPVQVLCELEALFDTVTMVQAVAVRRLREARGLDATGEVCGRGTKAWLTEEMLLAGAEAGRFNRLAQQLHYYPATEAAFDTARITIGHVSAILTALATLPPSLRETVEPHLIERATTHPPEEIAGFVDELLERLGLDKTSDVQRERRHAARRVDVGRTLDGHRSLIGTLTPDVGEQLEHALKLASHAGGCEDTRTAAQRAHDALGVIAAGYLAHHSQAPSFTGAPRTMIVTIDLETLENRLLEQWIRLPSGAVISAETARRMACDAGIIPMVLGSKSEVLDVGEADHEFTVAIRRAAYLRDGGRCAFPDCRNPVSELHHIVFRRHGGATSLDNAAWLCAYHHWLAHEGHWTLQRQPDNSYLWTGPHGQQCIRHLKTA